MATATADNGISFVFDRLGRKTHALIPIKEYERLAEDDYDNMIADSREDDGSISNEEFKQRIRRS